MPGSLDFLSLFVLLLGPILGTSGQNLCPDPDLILPCFCLSDLPSYTEVDCSQATSSDEIFFVFNNISWPITELWKFQLMRNEGVRELPEGVFGDVTFEEIIVQDTSVRSLHPSALLPSKDRLWSLQITDSALGDFPWDVIPQLTSLTHLRLYYNAITTLPPIQSASLQFFTIHHNEIPNLETGWTLPNLRLLALGSNPISEVSAGFFSGLGNLEEFYFQEVPIGSTLTNGSLEFLGAPISIIDIGRNSISTLESHAITGLESNTELDIRDNEIRELTEESFRPMLDLFSLGEGIINLHDNPVECDCSMAWIVLNPVFLESVLGTCTDGTVFQNLDPDIFEDLCLRRDPPMAGDYSTSIGSEKIPAINGI